MQAIYVDMSSPVRVSTHKLLLKLQDMFESVAEESCRKKSTRKPIMNKVGEKTWGDKKYQDL